MAFQLSPGVNVTEIDLTTVVPSVATSDGAFAGVFRWGPIEERVLLSTENDLVARFGKPTNHNAETFYTAANFLSYSNRLYVSRAADTIGATPTVSGNTSGANSVVLMSNTSDIEVGMYVVTLTNPAVLDLSSTVSVLAKNSSSITLSTNTTGTSNGISYYFGRPETSYTSVGFAPEGSGLVSNLVHQIVKNQNDYTNKDGNFDSDVMYVAKYPGALGNSLRVSVCDNADSFNSTVNLSNSTVNTAIQFTIGSNTAKINFVGSSNAMANTFAAYVNERDQIAAGNSFIGVQYLQVTGTSVSGNSTANVAVDSVNNINSVSNFISVTNNPFLLGDVVTYANNVGESEITGLTQGVNYHIVHANSSGFKVSIDPFGTETDITAGAGANSTFTANYNTLRINFEDPYRLHTNYVANTFDRNWEFFNVVDTAPGQSDYVLYNGNTSAQDELHVVVVDDGGKFTGTPGTVLEVFRGVSRATDAKNNDGTGNYYKDIINQSSKYIWWANDRSVAVSNTALNVTSSTAASPADIPFVHGSDGLSEADATLGILGAAYDMFVSPEDIDVSLVLQGKPIGGTTVVNGRTVNNFLLANYITQNICERRKDCIALISPDKATVVNNTGNEAEDLKSWRGALTSSSYVVLDSGWKYQYDRYNDVYRWIPLNGDIAGLCVRTDSTNDAWWSPAGFNRGQIKNLVKLAWNPRKAERDVIYANGINPVVTFPGQGTVLFGDKTLQAKPSAFDRINVRRLFIVLEKAISISAKYSLFEFNDEFTRAQFKNLVVPYLRTVKGRRGITDFLVVCDDTNNTQQIIDSNQFVGDIYIKPARSINFIQLNFVAVPTGVQFNEVIGKF